MTSVEYMEVVANGTLNNKPFGLPIVLDSTRKYEVGEEVVLKCAASQIPLAIMVVADVWQARIDGEAPLAYDSEGKCQGEHPFVSYLKGREDEGNGKLYYLGGPIISLGVRPAFAHRQSVTSDLFFASPYTVPYHPDDIMSVMLTPDALNTKMASLGWENRVAFQTRNPLHRAHMEVVAEAYREVSKSSEGKTGVVIHAAVGATKDGDIRPDDRVRSYFPAVAFLNNYLCPGQDPCVILSLLPLSMRLAGPREALLHAVVRKNHGFTHFVAGRDHAGTNDCYTPDRAQVLLAEHGPAIGIKPVFVPGMVYVPSVGSYVRADSLSDPSLQAKSISGTKLRAMLAEGRMNEVPEWFSLPEVLKTLAPLYPTAKAKGTIVLLSGLSGSGKTTLALHLRAQMASKDVNVKIIDGDTVRALLGNDLGYTAADRLKNAKRIGNLAADAVSTNRNTLVVVATMAPFKASREAIRSAVARVGANFVPVFLNTSVSECASRDVKGLYARHPGMSLAGSEKEIELPSSNEGFLYLTEGSVSAFGDAVSEAVEKVWEL